MNNPVAELIAPADVQAVADKATAAALAFVEEHRLAVVDVATLQRAVQIRTAIGERQKKIVADLAKPKSWAYGLHKWFCSLEAAALAPYELLDAYEREEIRKYNAAEERARQEREREATEARRRDEETRAVAEAAQLEAAGEPELAAAVVAQQIAAPPPVVVLPSITKQVTGLKFVTRWLWKYAGGPADIQQTPPEVLARAKAITPREFLCFDEKKIGAFARSMKDSGRIPGIDIYSVDDPVR